MPPPRKQNLKRNRFDREMSNGSDEEFIPTKSTKRKFIGSRPPQKKTNDTADVGDDLFPIEFISEREESLKHSDSEDDDDDDDEIVVNHDLENFPQKFLAEFAELKDKVNRIETTVNRIYSMIKNSSYNSRANNIREDNIEAKTIVPVFPKISSQKILDKINDKCKDPDTRDSYILFLLDFMNIESKQYAYRKKGLNSIVRTGLEAAFEKSFLFNCSFGKSSVTPANENPRVVLRPYVYLLEAIQTAVEKISGSPLSNQDFGRTVSDVFKIFFRKKKAPKTSSDYYRK